MSFERFRFWRRTGTAVPSRGAASVARLLMPWVSGILLTALVAVPIALFIWLIFFTPIFTVQAVAVVDARPHITEQARTIADARIAALPWRQNIFFVSTEQLAQEIEASIPEIRTVRVTRQLPGTVKVIVQEKEPAVLFLSGGSYYFVDESGVAYERARLDTLPGEVLPIVKNDDPHAQVTLGIAVVNPALVQFVQLVAQELPKRINAGVAEIRIPSLSAREVRFHLENNWELRFDSTRAAEQQLDILQQLLAGTITAEEQQLLEYVDLRIPDRVYYRTAGSALAQPSPTPDS